MLNRTVKISKKIVGLVIVFVLALGSVPWIMWALACASIGDEQGSDSAFESSPLTRWFDWVENR